MIIKTKKTKIAGNNSQGEMIEQTAEEKKPGKNFKQKVVESYKTKIKPGIKKAVSEASSDFKELVSK